MTLDLNKSDDELKRDLENAEAEGVKSEKRMKRILLIMIPVVILCVGSVVAFLGYAAYQRNLSRERMNTNGIEVAATMDNEFTQAKYKDGTSSYTITYHFKASDGITYTNTAEMSLKPNRFEKTVVYDPLNPNMNKLVGSGSESTEHKETSWGDAIAKGISFMIIAVVLGAVKKWMGKNRKLLLCHY